MGIYWSLTIQTLSSLHVFSSGGFHLLWRYWTVPMPGELKNEACFRRPQIRLRLHQLNSDGRNSVIPGTNVTNSKAMTITR